MDLHGTITLLAEADGMWSWAFVAMGLLWVFLLGGAVTLYDWLIRTDANAKNNDFDRGV